MVDASNAFNSINREAFLHNSKVICPSVAPYINNIFYLNMFVKFICLILYIVTLETVVSSSLDHYLFFFFLFMYVFIYLFI